MGNTMGNYTRYTVFIQMDAAATINIQVWRGAASIRERLLFEGGVYYVYTSKLPE